MQANKIDLTLRVNILIYRSTFVYSNKYFPRNTSQSSFILFYDFFWLIQAYFLFFFANDKDLLVARKFSSVLNVYVISVMIRFCLH